MNEDKAVIEVPALLSSISFTKDNGMRLGFTTQELKEEEKLIIQRFFQKFGWLLFSSNSFQEKDIPVENVEDKTKTPAKRLRAVLFVLYKQTKTEQDFEVWYRNKMEKLIDMVKVKLD